MAELSYTQLDPSVLSELPQELRDELAAVLPSTSRAWGHSKLPNLLKQHPVRGNRAILLQQQQQHDCVHSEAGQEQTASNKNSAVDEPADELWTELQLALQGLSAATEPHTATDILFSPIDRDEQQEIARGKKFAALSEVVLQWTDRQVENNLEDVSYLLRRLVGYSAASDTIQLGVARLVTAIQQLVKAAHGAKLQLQQPLA